VEFWTYPLGTGNWVIAHGDGSIAGTSISWQYGHGTFDFYYGSSYVQITSPTLTLNSWQHIAVVRNGATITVYKDGVSTGTGNIGSNTLNTGGTDPFYVGNYPDAGSGYINGYLSDVRVVKGTAVYTSNFTPPTAPLTAITNTKLLLNMKDGQAIDSAAQSNLTLYGNANTSTDQAKFGTTSLHLDGTGDYAEVASNIGAWGTGNFTVEGWYYLTAQAQYDNLFDFRTSGNTSHLDIYFDDDPLRIHVFFGGTDRINANAATPTNEWVHIAVVRNGSTTTLYQNGTSLGTSTTVTTFTEGALRIGNRYFGDYYMQGYVDEFRVSKMARYTSNFTAPTKAFADKGQ
jgi:hypothetical protein